MDYSKIKGWPTKDTNLVEWDLEIASCINFIRNLIILLKSWGRAFWPSDKIDKLVFHLDKMEYTLKQSLMETSLYHWSKENIKSITLTDGSVIEFEPVAAKEFAIKGNTAWNYIYEKSLPEHEARIKEIEEVLADENFEPTF